MVYFSIITVNKNNCHGLEKTIRSVVDQTYNNFELIIIDGNSMDGSIEIIKQFEHRISYWVSEEDTGIYHAMNKGIAKSHGHYCLFLNSGDYLYNNNILREVAHLDLKEDIVSGDIIKFSDFHENTELFSRIRHSDITFFDLFNNSLNHQASFIKRALYDKYGLYEEKYKVISDWVFMLKTIVINNVSFRYIPMVISYYNEDGISNGKTNYYIDERIPALNELIPKRILADYNILFKRDMYNAQVRLNRYWLPRVLVKSISFLISKYESITIRF
jgi:glycosyltransferase involved in cell wall biosynthesis